MRHATIAEKVLFEGAGLQLGLPGVVEVHPARFGSGVTFQARSGPKVPARIDRATGEPGCTALAAGEFHVRTVEHLLAALVGLGITDAEGVVDGPEIPAMDGSAAPFAAAFVAAGIEIGPPVSGAMVVEQELVVEAHGGRARFVPALGCVVSVDVDFGEPPYPRGQVSISLPGESFLRDVAWARTFVLDRDLDRLRAQGRGRGATEENTVVYGVLGPGGPVRSDDEAVRHKLVDAIGDLALLGRPLIGKFEVFRGSHALHRQAVARLALEFNGKFR